MDRLTEKSCVYVTYGDALMFMIMNKNNHPSRILISELH